MKPDLAVLLGRVAETLTEFIRMGVCPFGYDRVAIVADIAALRLAGLLEDVERRDSPVGWRYLTGAEFAIIKQALAAGQAGDGGPVACDHLDPDKWTEYSASRFSVCECGALVGFDRAEPSGGAGHCVCCVHGSGGSACCNSPAPTQGEVCLFCNLPRAAHFHPGFDAVGGSEPWPSKRWHCGRCKQPMQFADGICVACNGGRDPGD